MTIDEAIAHEKELAKKSYLQGMLCHANPDDGKLDGYIESGKEHEQLAEWLEELRSYRSVGVPLLQHFNDVEIYNQAIDDFVKAIICELKNKYTDMPIVDIFGSRKKWKEKNSQYLECENLAYKIAEQLKEGGKNEYNI